MWPNTYDSPRKNNRQQLQNDIIKFLRDKKVGLAKENVLSAGKPFVTQLGDFFSYASRHANIFSIFLRIQVKLTCLHFQYFSSDASPMSLSLTFSHYLPLFLSPSLFSMLMCLYSFRISSYLIQCLCFFLMNAWIKK